ncbi:MAG TPA: LPS export ABC transporter periplasmic protein LptC [Pyrinomonadaceae bacterium]|nr:LPS export ABC transporter periplasmic protein LptC [Pyrinomonadaceae bacterium]
MQAIRRRKVTLLGLRTAAPKYVRVLALGAAVATIIVVVVALTRMKEREVFRMRPGVAELSKELVGKIENLEHVETRDGRLYMVLKASLDLKFSDGHHELENVYLEVYPKEGEGADKIRARRTVTNEDNTYFAFTGEVVIETRDGLVVKSESIEYEVREEKGRVTAPVTFERENVSGRADSADLKAKEKHLELRGNVEITVRPEAPGQQPGAATQPAGAPSLKGVPRGQPVTVRAQQAVFDQPALKLAFSGGATAEQGAELMSGETLEAHLSEQKRVRFIASRRNAYLRSNAPGRAAEVSAAELFFDFNADQKLEHARALTNVQARTLDADSEMRLSAPAEAWLFFTVQEGRSLLREMRAAGRPVVTLSAPQSKAADPNAANKRLVADQVRLFWRGTGRDLERAEAEGNAELLIEPANPSPAADRKTVFAARFDCAFHEAGNLARTANATGGAKAVVDPLQPSETRHRRVLTSREMQAHFVRETQDVERVEARGEARFAEAARTLASDNMTAQFGRQTQALERVDAEGDAKFNEADRNGQAATFSYTARDGVVRLRGGEPTAWDSRARLKAAEIDSDTRSKVTHARGKVTTTYYSQEQTGGAAPFQNVRSPVFIASANAEFQHETGVGVYTGAARAWQDDNFVRADRLVLRREQSVMEGFGDVQSALYQARRKEAGGARAVVPVFASSERMSYSDAERLLRYVGRVDIRQGTERITGGTADVFLTKDSYEVERTIAQQSVVVTQPGRRGTGDWAQYTAADETVVLTGNPARVEDAERGTNESRRMVVYLREERVVSDGGGPETRQSTGRVRSTHKVRKQ